MHPSRKPMRRRIALSGAILMLFAVLTGCNGTGGSACPNTVTTGDTTSGGSADSSSGGSGSGGGETSSNLSGTQLASTGLSTDSPGDTANLADSVPGSQGAVWDIAPPGTGNGDVRYADNVTVTGPDGTPLPGQSLSPDENTYQYAVYSGDSSGDTELVSDRGKGGTALTRSGWQNPGLLESPFAKGAQVTPDGIGLNTNGGRALSWQLVTPASSNPTLSGNVNVTQWPANDAPWTGNAGANNAPVRLGAGFGQPNAHGIPPYAVQYVVVPDSAVAPASRDYTQSYPLNYGQTQIHEIYVPASQATNFSANPVQDLPSSFQTGGPLPLTEIFVAGNSNHGGRSSRAFVGNLRIR